MIKLDKNFFLKDTLWVARNLLGKQIFFDIDNKKSAGIITETEAYFGDDPASHGAKGQTIRNEAMFCEGGVSYVYMIYGIYYCLNIVTEKEGFPAAVLIRGINLLEPEKINLNGPGKICKYLGINKNHNKINLCQEKHIELYDNGLVPEIKATTRIGISKNTDKLWRFLIYTKS